MYSSDKVLEILAILFYRSYIEYNLGYSAARNMLAWKHVSAKKLKNSFINCVTSELL
jgi:hypothetical protein